MYLERLSNIKPFINKYNWDEINYPSKIEDWKTLEKSNPTIALNILYTKEKQTYPAYISKINSNCEKQVVLLIVPNKEKEGLWRYLVVKKLPTLVREITSKHHGAFYCLNCLHFRAKNKLKSHKKVPKSKDFCGILIPSERNKILEFKQFIESDKKPYIIYA